MATDALVMVACNSLLVNGVLINAVSRLRTGTHLTGTRRDKEKQESIPFVSFCIVQGSAVSQQSRLFIFPRLVGTLKTGLTCFGKMSA
jgi:hypothetical protein